MNGYCNFWKNYNKAEQSCSMGPGGRLHGWAGLDYPWGALVLPSGKGTAGKGLPAEFLMFIPCSPAEPGAAGRSLSHSVTPGTTWCPCIWEGQEKIPAAVLLMIGSCDNREIDQIWADELDENSIPWIMDFTYLSWFICLLAFTHAHKCMQVRCVSENQDICGSVCYVTDHNLAVCTTAATELRAHCTESRNKRHIGTGCPGR